MKIVFVILREQVKVGTFGAEESGDFEEWFNYRVSRAAPNTSAEFLGTFIADQNSLEFVKGGKWLVWKFQVGNLVIFSFDSYHHMSFGIMDYFLKM